MTEHDIRAHLLHRYQDWMKAIVDKDIDAIASIYADDAIYLPAGKPRHVGKEAVLSVWRSHFERADFRAQYTPSLTVSESLDLAYDVGAYVVTLTREEKEIEIRGKYVVVWRNDSGRWVAAVDIDNTDHPS
jgi:ketosteroid isomerase-like protein